MLYYDEYGSTATQATNIIAVMTASFLRVVSTDFLLQYSFPHENHPIHAHSHPFGDIKSTEKTNADQLARSKIIRRVFIADSYR